MEKLTVRERIRQYAEFKNYSIYEVSKNAGLPRTTLFNNNKAGEDIIQKFSKAYPEVSLEWLIFGEGEMIKRNLTRVDHSKQADEQAASADRVAESTGSYSIFTGSNPIFSANEIFAKIVDNFTYTVKLQEQKIEELEAKLNQYEQTKS